MPAHHKRDDTGPQVPRWAATAGRSAFAARLAARGARLFCSPHRRHATNTADNTTASRGDAAEISWAVRQRVLRDYHAANLAHARRASEELVRAGFNTGAVPYGYRAHRVRVSPAGGRPRWRTRLVIEPVEAAVVKMIFTWRAVEQVSSAEIRRRLVEGRYPAPLDPQTRQPGVWTQAHVRAVLRSNPKYLGRQVWGRRHHRRRVPRSQWVWSPPHTHAAILDEDTLTAAVRRQAGDHPPTGHKPTRNVA